MLTNVPQKPRNEEKDFHRNFKHFSASHGEQSLMQYRIGKVFREIFTFASSATRRWVDFWGVDGICLNVNENFPSSNAKVFPTIFSGSSPEGSDLMRSTKTSKFSSYHRVISWNLIEFLCNLHWTLRGIKNFFSNFTYSILSALSLGSLPGFFRIFFLSLQSHVSVLTVAMMGVGEHSTKREREEKNCWKTCDFCDFFLSSLSRAQHKPMWTSFYKQVEFPRCERETTLGKFMNFFAV